MKYTCANCNSHFESDDDEPRCPRCLRKHGLITEPAGGPTRSGGGSAKVPAAAGPGRRRAILIAGVAVVLAVGAIAAWWLLHRSRPATGPRDVSVGPVSGKTLRDVARQRGVTLDTLPFEVDGALRTAAQGAARLGDGGKAAERLLADLKQWTGAKGPLRVKAPGRLKRASLLGAAQVLAAARGGHETTVVSYELASLYLALARGAGLHAVMVEIFRHSDRPGPADPRGYLGHFGVAVFPKPDYSGRPPVVVDPARGTLNTAKEFEVLTDLRAVAHFLALRALHQLTSEAEPASAADALEKALRLAPRAATLHAAKGMLLLESGGLQPAYDAFRAASALREDPSRLLCLALVRLSQQDLKGAMTLLDQALGLEPSYAVARAMRAMVLASQAKLDDASAELDRADQIEPGLPETLQTRALLLLSQDKAEQGIALLRQAVAREPEDEQLRFQLWRVLTQLGREAEAQAASDDWLKDLSTRRRELVGQQLAAFRKALKEAGNRGGGAPGAPGGDPFKLKDPTMGPDKSGAFPAQPGDPSDKDPMLSL